MTIEALIFDLDGLLIDSERLSQRSWSQVMAEAGYLLSEDIYHQMIGRTEKDVKAILKQAFGNNFPFEDMYRKREQRFFEIIEQEGMPRKAGWDELAQYILQNGLRTAVASSTYRRLAEKKLSAARLLSFFEVIVTGDEVSHGKPAPDLFLTAASKLAIPPEKCVVLEDSEAGIQAAYNAGMKCIHIPDIQPISPQTLMLVWHQVSSLAKVREILEKEIS
ncbi:HAD family hydrolase [Anaerolinea thermophila]|uniref:Hydrolase n=1 Tax=Anaerolinea thermophila (strain DSM 14523 / JCM 11388 / NBRC 100420 / UNI-1) TaxID=926569 RepID=E8N5Q5_ANATU|nr:HAD family phosphatase [Anaerolinea thermophila]BAJ63769.1 putative hydrolase [Anaerolinea thermophila UNI-1]